MTPEGIYAMMRPRPWWLIWQSFSTSKCKQSLGKNTGPWSHSMSENVNAALNCGYSSVSSVRTLCGPAIDSICMIRQGSAIALRVKLDILPLALSGSQYAWEGP